MKGAIRTLLVDDSTDLQIIVRITLQSSGRFIVDVAGSGEEALARLAGGLPDLVLLDVMMPGMDGIETLRRLRALPGAANLPVIFLTAKVLEHERAEYLALGALGLIPKPFDPDTLAEEILSLDGFREGAAEPPGSGSSGAGGALQHGVSRTPLRSG